MPVDRERKVDISKLPQDQIDQLGIQIGDKVRQLCDEAAVKVNSVLSIYGMSAKIAIAFDTLPSEFANLVETPKKRQRKTKKDNLNKEPKS